MRGEARRVRRDRQEHLRRASAPVPRKRRGVFTREREAPVLSNDRLDESAERINEDLIRHHRFTGEYDGRRVCRRRERRRRATRNPHLAFSPDRRIFAHRQNAVDALRELTHVSRFDLVCAHQTRRAETNEQRGVANRKAPRAKLPRAVDDQPGSKHSLRRRPLRLPRRVPQRMARRDHRRRRRRRRRDRHHQTSRRRPARVVVECHPWKRAVDRDRPRPSFASHCLPTARRFVVENVASPAVRVDTDRATVVTRARRDARATTDDAARARCRRASSTRRARRARTRRARTRSRGRGRATTTAVRCCSSSPPR